ncbi:MAG TPA: LysR substrate-binding domain-containing protein [Alphaproteobacteria bacterium]|nr:LysR substrate-binding domain-containing protein [Alphaproteobacteria bacterium]
MAGPLPLLALRAFAEVGTTGRVKDAAAALGVTPGAVSQHLAYLEARLGAPLLRRTGRGMRLTPEGARLHAAIAPAFGTIAAAVAEFRADRAPQALALTTTASFAATWLVPRLGRFAAHHPEIELRIDTAPGLADLRRDGFDLALRHGLGDYPGLVATRFLAPRLVPVGCPALLARLGPVAAPADCLRFPLLQDADRADWGLWLRAQGAADDPLARRGPAFADDFLLLRAARDGAGLALVRDVYAAEDLAAGRLALAIDRPWPLAFAYYIVTTPDSARRPAVRAFTAWVQAEAELAEAVAAQNALVAAEGAFGDDLRTF